MQLAKCVEREEAWPLRMTARALSTRLAALDREDELVWWTRDGDRMAAARVLARSLALNEQEVLDRIDAGANKRLDDPAEWPLPVDVMPIDLKSERPFPGIPRTVLAPRDWRRVWWHAPPGAGRSLVGAWLRQQGFLVDVERFATWADFAAALSDRDSTVPLYCEVDSNAGLTVDGLDLPEGLRVCVAAPFAAPGLATTSHDHAEGRRLERHRRLAKFLASWRYIKTAPPGEWLDELIAWLIPRFAGRGNIQSISDFIRDSEHWTDMVGTPGGILELMAVLEVYGLPSPEQRDATGLWIQRYVALLATQKLPREAPVRAVLEAAGGRVLTAAVRGCLRAEQDSGDAHPAASWAAWIGPVAPASDPSAAIAILERTRRRPDSASIAEALSHLRPLPSAIVDGLVACGVLRADGDAGLKLAPAWLKTFVEMFALSNAVDAGPGEVGPLLVAGVSRDFIIEELFERAMEGDWRFAEATLAAWTGPRDVSTAMCVDVAFRAAGFSVLQSAAHPPCLKALWDAAHACAVIRHQNGYPRPLFDGGASDEAFNRWGVWEVACITLSEHLGREAHNAHPALAPWGREKSALLSDSLRCVETALTGLAAATTADDAAASEWEAMRLRGYRLAGRLFDEVGCVADRAGSTRPVGPMAPAILVVAFANQEAVPTEALSQLTHLRDAVPALQQEAAARGVEWDALLRWLWEFWGQLANPSGALPFRWLGHARPGTEDLWHGLPPAAAGHPDIARAIAKQGAWRFLASDAAWAAFLHSAILSGVHHELPTDAWLAAPRTVLLDGLREGTFAGSGNHEVQRVLWDRFPDSLAEMVSGGTLADNVLRAVLVSAPDTVSASLIAARPSDLDQDYPGAWVWRAWLHECVMHQRPGWTVAYCALVGGAK